MQSLANILENQFRYIANDLNHRITDSEIGLYVAELSDMGLRKIVEACLAFTVEKPEAFPSVSDFRSKIREIGGRPSTSLSMGA